MSAIEPTSHARLSTTAWCVLLAILIGNLLHCVVRPDVYMDGEMYAAIARNMALGFGDLWHPAFSPGMGAQYFENPPLAFLLQSWAFCICGDHFWVEKLYSFSTGLVTVVIVAAIWRRLTGKQSVWAAYSWLPIALWLLWPRWLWQYENNWLENTMAMFASLAVYCAVRTSESSRIQSIWIPLGACATLAGFLTKGPTALFPLAAPLLMWFALRRQPLRRAVAVTALWLLICCAGFCLILLNPAAREFFSKYCDQQVLASLAGDREHSTAWGHFFILKAIKNSLRIPAIVTLAILLIDYARRRWTAKVPSIQLTKSLSDLGPLPRGALWFCLLTAASASLPIMISPKQWTHYAFPSFPYFVLAMAFWCAPALARLLNTRPAISLNGFHPALRIASALTVAGFAFVALQAAGLPNEDRNLLHDTQVLGELLEPNTVIGASGEFASVASFRAYLSRWANIGVNRASAQRAEFLLLPLDESDASPPGYISVPTDMVQFRLYQRSPVRTVSAISDEPAPE